MEHLQSTQVAIFYLIFLFTFKDTTKYSTILFVAAAIFLGQTNGQEALSKCRAERQKGAEANIISTFIPRCQDDGSYSPRQCNLSTGYCYCLIPTGERISMYTRKPLCC